MLQTVKNGLRSGHVAGTKGANQSISTRDLPLVIAKESERTNCCPPAKHPGSWPDPGRCCPGYRICWKLFSGRFIGALGHHFKEVVLAMLWGEEEPTIVDVRRLAAQET